jgi:hypothetical protein
MGGQWGLLRRCILLDPERLPRRYGEKIMSKSNDTSKLGDAKLENRVLAESELDAVTGGYVPTAVEQGDIKLTIGSQDHLRRLLK